MINNCLYKKTNIYFLLYPHGLFNIGLLKSAKATGTQFDASPSYAMFVYILKRKSEF